MSVKRCTQCVSTETHESITFDENGVCNVCNNISQKNAIDWGAKDKEFRTLIEKYRGKHAYDCIVPFSGGKDSAYTVYAVARKFKLKPLVVTFDHGFMRPTVLANVERAVRTLGVDYLKFRANWHVVKKVMMESLIRKGDFCWHCHCGLFSYPMQIAVKFKVPLIIWGEPSAEYTSYYSYDAPEEVDEKRFNRFINLGITAEDMTGMLGPDVDPRDLEPYRYPPLKELRAINYRSICLGSYYPWNVQEQVKIIMKELDWKGEQVEGVPPGYEYEKIECQMQGVRDYIKYIKRGYARPTHLASIDLRHGRIDRDKAIEMIDKYEGLKPASLKVFLGFFGMSEQEFNEIAMKHVVAPHQPDIAGMKEGHELWDQKLWEKK